MNKDDVVKIQDEILLAALAHVVFDGWNWEAVVLGAADAGHSEQSARGVFPGQVIDVLDGFAALADRRMMAALADVDADELRVRDRVRVALMARYGFLAEHKDALRQSVQFWAVPTRKVRGGKLVWRTADVIWNWAGDTATDYNRYTKRWLLSGIIVSSTLYWMNDSCETLDNLERFVDRRIDNVMKFGKILSRKKKA
jgi:ubiquinone biosynthesis protein COQ9